MLTVKLLYQKYLGANCDLTTGDPCIKILSKMSKNTSVSLSYKTPKSQRSLNSHTGLNKAYGVTAAKSQRAINFDTSSKKFV